MVGSASPRKPNVATCVKIGEACAACWSRAARPPAARRLRSCRSRRPPPTSRAMPPPSISTSTRERLGVERVLDQLLDRARRALHHLARRDLARQLGRQNGDARRLHARRLYPPTISSRRARRLRLRRRPVQMSASQLELGGGLHLGGRLRHGKALTGALQHRHVVQPVAHRHHVFDAPRRSASPATRRRCPCRRPTARTTMPQEPAKSGRRTSNTMCCRPGTPCQRAVHAHDLLFVAHQHQRGDVRLVRPRLAGAPRRARGAARRTRCSSSSGSDRRGRRESRGRRRT